MTVTIKTHPKDTRSALSASEWLQGEKYHLRYLGRQIIKMEHRLNKQSGWIMFLVSAVIMLIFLSLGLFALLMMKH
ncbi:hypothetical protein [Moraxella catarrhalis]|uniref:hypothetical protein n=1 Tax=Moraxella catarrhalis TaxID=480 RepID=UPI0007E3B46B|nr:hypothetical protein [Moraxella catarrhalis]OAV09563.1 hypothetical protein AO378_1242 [Moraxella catarrhalis]